MCHKPVLRRRPPATTVKIPSPPTSKTRTTTPPHSRMEVRTLMPYFSSPLGLSSVSTTSSRYNTPTRLDVFLIVILRPMAPSPLSACLCPLTHSSWESSKTVPVSRHCGERRRVGCGWCQRTIPFPPLFIIPRRRYPNSFIPS